MFWKGVILHLSPRLSIETNAGLAEPGVQGVQLHTYFLDPLFASTQVLSWKILITK